MTSELIVGLRQLVKVEHWRCGEQRYQTLAWAPAEWTADDIDAAVFRAHESYVQRLTDWKVWRGKEQPPHAWQPDYKGNPELTVREVDEIFGKQKASYDAWNEQFGRFHGGFAGDLEAQGMEDFWRHDPDVTVNVDWGHRHGENLDLQPTEWEDLPGMIPYPDDF